MFLALQLILVRGVEPPLTDAWLDAPEAQQQLAIRALQSRDEAEVAWVQIRPGLPLAQGQAMATGRVRTLPDGTRHSEGLSIEPMSDDDGVRAHVVWNDQDLVVGMPAGRDTASGRSEDGTLWLLHSARVDSTDAAARLFADWAPPTPPRASRRALRALQARVD